MRQEITTAGLKVSPPVIVAVWNHLSTIPAEKWLTYITIAYVVLQAIVIVRDKFLPKRRRRTDRKAAK